MYAFRGRERLQDFISFCLSQHLQKLDLINLEGVEYELLKGVFHAIFGSVADAKLMEGYAWRKDHSVEGTIKYHKEQIRPIMAT